MSDNKSLLSEEILRRFFDGSISATDLAKRLPSISPSKSGTTHHPIEDAQGDFVVTPTHLLRVCDAVMAGELSPEHLRIIGFCILASDYFELPSDEEAARLVGSITNEWATPEINLPLTLRSVRLWRSHLRRHKTSPQGEFSR